MDGHYLAVMPSTQQNQTLESTNDLYADMLKHMYFGTLIYWSNLFLQGQRNMFNRLTSHEADIQRGQEDAS